MKKSNEGYSMPLGSPPYQPPPYPAGREAELLWVEFEADLGAMEEEVPEPLTLAQGKPALAWIFDAPQLSRAIYHEGAILLPVEYNGIVGHYVPYIWGDLDEPMFLNREIYGWPQLLCDADTLRKHGNTVTGSISRKDSLLMELSVFLERRADPDEPSLLPDWLQVRKFPSPLKDGPPLRQVVHTVVKDTKIHELWKGRSSVRLAASSEFAIEKLNPTRILQAFFAVVTFDLPPPTAVWDA